MPVVIDHWLRLGPRNASKVEKLSSREVSYLHHWSLMLLPVLYIHVCALSAHTRALLRVSISAIDTHLWLATIPLSLPGAGTVCSDILGPIV